MQSQAFKILLEEVRKVGKDLKGAESRLHYRIDRHVDKLGKRVDDVVEKTETVRLHADEASKMLREKLAETQVDVGRLKVRVGVFAGIAAAIGVAASYLRSLL